MIPSHEFLSQCKKHDYRLFSGTPCSYLKPFINSVIEDEELRFVEVTNEGDAVALSSGARLNGQRSVVMFQNSGLGNAVNPLTSLNAIFKIPFIGIVTLRGEPDGPKDEPQHQLMGKITTELLDKMEIPWSYFPTQSEDISAAFQWAHETCESQKTPYFFVMRKGSVESFDLEERKISYVPHSEEGGAVTDYSCGKREMSRTKALKTIKSFFPPNGSALLATTGKAGRELFEMGDDENQLYMVGSMGCALPLGLGVKISGHKEKLGVIDGDGALLMRLGNMALAGQLSPDGLIHIVLDNGVHDSTGRQRSYSEKVDFVRIAKACGYQSLYQVDDVVGLEKALKDSFERNELCFIRCMITPGSPSELGRPTLTPEQVGNRFQNYLGKLK